MKRASRRRVSPSRCSSQLAGKLLKLKVVRTSVTALLVASLIGAPAAYGQVANSKLTPDVDTPIAVSTSLDEIYARGEADLSSTFAGTRISPDQRSIIVYATSDDGEIGELVSRLSVANDIRIDVVVVPRSLSYLKSGEEQISDHFGELLQAQIRPLIWGPDVEKGVLFVELENATNHAQDVLEKIAGQPVEIRPSRGSPEAFVGRATDTPKWNAGDAISNGSGQCSSGFAVKDPVNHWYFMTADHCFNNGDMVKNYKAAYPTAGSSSNNMGLEVINQGNINRDMALIDASGSGLVWQGGPATNAVIGVGGVATVSAGSHVYHSGAIQGENGDFIVQNSARFCISLSVGGGVYRTDCEVYQANGAQFTSRAGPGDSGGPVYTKANGKVYAAGVLAGGLGGGYSVGCVHYTGSSCSYGLLFTDFRTVANLWSLTPILR